MSRKKERFLCGVVEGFYGRPWTIEQRLDLFSMMSQCGMNSYLYAPKDDDKHRAYWRDLYSLEEADQLSQLAQEASARGINFIYAISPGLDITFSSSKEVALLKRKLDQVTDLGCASFAILFDDIDCDMCPADAKQFPSFAHAQVTVTNEIYSHLDHPETFLFCPTEYCSSRAIPSVSESQYLKHLGAELHPTIDIMWTGPKVISKTLPVSSVDELARVLQRPPVIWDNLHANDYDQRRLFLGPYVGRSVSLLPRLNGVLTNPNCEYGANYVALHTLAQWSRCAGVMAKRPSPARQAMQLELEGSSDGEVTSTPTAGGDGSVGKGTIAKAASPLTDDDLTDLHLYEPKRALEAALKEWLSEFKVPRRSAEHYQPAKDAASVIKAVDMDQMCSALSDGSVEILKVPAEITPGQEPADPEGCASPVSSKPFTLDDLRLLVDFFYLPHQHGERSLHILEEFCWLKENAPGYDLLKVNDKLKGERMGETSGKASSANVAVSDGMRSDGETEGCGDEMTASEVAKWCDRANRFHDSCNEVAEMFDRLTAIPNRPLLYDVYQYMWDAKETTIKLDSYVSWLESGGNQVNPNHQPYMNAGGIVAEMQRLLQPKRKSHKLRADCDTLVYTVRPYQPEDRDLTYQVCLETGDSGNDATDLFPNFPDILGDRFVGPYTSLNPDLSFVLEDSEGVCGYVLGALDSEKFYDRFRKAWLPTVVGKYPKIHLNSPPEATTTSKKEEERDVSAEEELLREIYAPKFFLPATLQKNYPSHLHIDLMGRAQGRAIGGKMVRTIISALKAKGSRGVHLEMSAHNKRALKFYTKLGFTVLDVQSELTAGGFSEEILILGRSL